MTATNCFLRTLLVAVLLLVPAGSRYAAAADKSPLPAPSKATIDFVQDVQPIFRQSCFECHAGNNEEGGLNLGVKARALKGGENGPVVLPGDSAASPLIQRVASADEDMVMPPEGDRLSDNQIGILRAWIDQGAKWPDGADVLDPKIDRARSHWAFQPLSDVNPPAVENTDWVQTPIDQFILAALKEQGIQPTHRANSRVLIRRLYFDLIGLPPTPDEIAAFEKSAITNQQSAIERLVRTLLDSRHYGERWGRHWLDVARYADSDGQEADRDRPTAYHYRDFVIRALNDDMPFDQFVRWQIAGDEIEPKNPAAVAATGFLVAGPHTVLEKTFLEEERLRNRYNELDDMLSTIGSGILGVTIGCARCHDHKYDAVSAREYYQMLSALHSGDRAEVPLNGNETALAFRDSASEPATTWLFGRGDFYDREQPVELGFVEVLMRGKTAQQYWQEAKQETPLTGSTYQREALARWLTDVEHGAGALVARVIVNRVWQHHFGEGIVHTVSDFGVRSEDPTHPELLEWLANDFIQNGWKLKRLHALIVRSSTYQQAGRPRRLEAEILRDAMLATSGKLNDAAYGPAFKPPIASEAMVARNIKGPAYPKDVKESPDTLRRSVYMFHKRVIPYPLLQAFDRPDLLQSCGHRDNTTVAPQALAMLNDDFVRTRSADFAQRLIDQCGDDNSRTVTLAFELALGRAPSEREQTASLDFIESQLKKRSSRDKKASAAETHRRALADFCQVVFGLNEFVYVD